MKTLRKQCSIAGMIVLSLSISHKPATVSRTNAETGLHLKFILNLAWLVRSNEKRGQPTEPLMKENYKFEDFFYFISKMITIACRYMKKGIRRQWKESNNWRGEK